jgi:hypothetical protein
MRSIPLVISAAAFLVWSQAVSACQVLTYEASLAEADIVFTGTLTAVSERPKTQGGKRPFDAVFEVTQPLKGEVPQSITIRDIGKNCYDFPQFSLDETASREYLVFAARDSDGTYMTFHPLANTPITDEQPYAMFKERAGAFIKSVRR